MKPSLPAVLVLLLVATTVSADSPIRIRMMVSDGLDTIPVVNRLVEEFERANPGIEVKVDRVPEQKEQKFLTQYAAGRAPDVFSTNVGNYSMFAFREMFWTVDELTERYGNSIDQERYYPGLKDLYTIGDRLWALPTSVNSPMLVFYNRKHFREAGIPEPDGTWTYTLGVRPELREHDFFWVVQQFSKTDPDPKKRRWGFTTAWPQLFGDALLITQGLKLWNDDTNPTEVRIDTPEVNALLQFASDTVRKHKWVPAFGEIQQGMGSSMAEQFLQGRISMFQTGGWHIMELRKDAEAAGLEWGITTFPAYEGRPFRALAEGGAMAVSRRTKHPREAWLLAQWMASEHAQTELAKTGQNQPAFRDLALKPGVWMPDPNGPDAWLGPQLMATDRLAMSLEYAKTPEYFAPVRNAIQGTFFGIISEQQDPKEAIQRVQRDMEVRLAAELRRLDPVPYPWVPATVVVLLLFGGIVAWVYLPERGIKYTARQQRQNRKAYVMLIPWIIGILLTAGPMGYSLLLSFSQSDMVRPTTWVGLRNYTDAFGGVDPAFWNSIKVTGIFTLMSIPVGVAASLALALLLNQKVKGMPVWRAMFYLPSLASTVAMSLVWIRILHPENGLVNRLIYDPRWPAVGEAVSNWAGTPGQPVNWWFNEATVLPSLIVMGLWGAGGGTIIFLAGLQNISPQYYEAATIDGAGIWQRFRRITLPLLSPTMFFSLVTGVIGSFQVFTQAFVITQGGPNSKTYFYMLNLYYSAFRDLKMGYASALAWVLFVIIFAFTAAQFLMAKRWVFYEGGDAR